MTIILTALVMNNRFKPIPELHTEFPVLSFLDIDECSTDNGGCEFLCSNTESSYFCSCPSGYSLDSNGHNCTG